MTCSLNVATSSLLARGEIERKETEITRATLFSCIEKVVQYVAYAYCINR